jgi:hypothetical protein
MIMEDDMSQIDSIGKSHSHEQDVTHILAALQGIRYGSLEVIVHDSRIVQIERKEKLRFERGR